MGFLWGLLPRASDRKRMTRDFTVQARKEDHVQSILDALLKIEEIQIQYFPARSFTTTSTEPRS
jgi:hypothetical protein